MNRAAALALPSLFMFLVACQGAGSASRVLKPDQFGDIPVPKGATYQSDHEQSYSYSSDTFRCGRFLYAYSGTVEQALSFFRTWMTNDTYAWTFAEEGGPKAGSGRLVFAKNNDRCTIEVERLHGAKRADDEKPQHTVFIHIRLNYKYR